MKRYIARLKNSRMFGLVVKLLFVTGLSNAFTLAIPFVISYFFSVSQETDNFFLSYSIITFLAFTLATSLKTVLVPFIKDIMADRLASNRFVSTLICYSFVVVGGILLILLGTFFAIYLKSGEPIYQYLVFLLPVTFFIISGALLTGILNAHDHYNMAEGASIVRALSILISMLLLHDTYGVFSIIIGYNFGELFKTAWLYVIMLRKTNLAPSFKNADFQSIRPFLKHGSLQIVSSTLSASSPLVDRVVASYLFVGSVTLLDYGDRLSSIFGVLLNAVLVVVLSNWSADVTKDQFSITKFKKVLLFLFISASIISVLTIVFSGYLVDILYFKLEDSDQEIIAHLLKISMVTFVFNGMNQLVIRALIAFKESKWLFRTTSARAILNLIFNALFAFYFGLIGIAYATCLISVGIFMFNYISFLNRRG